MNNFVLGIAAFVAVSAIALSAQTSQDITGSWQGTLKNPDGQRRIVVKVSLEDGRLKSVLYSADQPSPAIPVTNFTRDGSAIKMTVGPLNATFEGKLGPDGNSISGTWSQGSRDSVVAERPHQVRV
jgi:hypothetical protein